MKFPWLNAPMQVLVNGQKWSIRITQWSTVEQWCERGGFQLLQNLQNRGE
jgi:hypothetical protein